MCQCGDNTRDWMHSHDDISTHFGSSKHCAGKLLSIEIALARLEEKVDKLSKFKITAPAFVLLPTNEEVRMYGGFATSGSNPDHRFYKK